MRRSVKLILPISIEALLPTIQAYTKAYNLVCNYGFNNNEYNEIQLHNKTYQITRRYLPSQLAISARMKAFESLKSVKPLLKKNKAKVPQSKLCSIRYDARSYSFINDNTISLLTINGRIKIPMPFIPKHFQKYLS